MHIYIWPMDNNYLALGSLLLLVHQKVITHEKKAPTRFKNYSFA